MLSTSELIALLEDLESDRVERTTSVNNTDKFCQAICAFSNDFPGHNNPSYLIIGANDRGDLTGLTITDRLLTNLADIRSSGNILPLPALTIQKYSFPEGELAVVEVFPSDIPPVRYIREFLMNAVMHRDYRSNAPIRFYIFNDRIEIQNPGGLYGSARPENFPEQNDYRNPVIAEALKVLGYVNKFSRGVY